MPHVSKAAQPCIPAEGRPLPMGTLGGSIAHADPAADYPAVMLALDADKAGLSAAMRSAHAALSAGMRVKAVRLPAGKDPADIISAVERHCHRRPN